MIVIFCFSGECLLAFCFSLVYHASLLLTAPLLTHCHHLLDWTSGAGNGNGCV